MIITIAFQVYIDYFLKPAKVDVAYLHDTPNNVSKPHPYVAQVDSRPSGEAPLLRDRQSHDGQYQDGQRSQSNLHEGQFQQDSVAGQEEQELLNSGNGFADGHPNGQGAGAFNQDKEGSLLDKEKSYASKDNGHALNRDSEESDYEKYGFLPPSMWKKQPTVWIADDKHGLGRIEVNRIRAGGVDATTDGATMDEKGESW